jgi:hypothetical protein
MAAPFDLFSPFKYFNVAPVTDWERFINPQFNITFNQADAAVENRVLAVAGSYGRQIGRMQEVLDVLLSRIAAGELTAVQERCVERYREVRSEVKAAVSAARPADEASARPQDIEKLLDRLAEIRDSDREQYERLVAPISQFLASADRTPASRSRRGG